MDGLPLQAQSATGLAAFCLIAWVLSERRMAFPVGFAVLAILSQFLIAGALLFLPPAREALGGLNAVTEALQQATLEGTKFVFGYVGGADAPFDVQNPNANFSFAFQALPILIFMSALSALLWHWGILKAVVRGLAFVLEKGFGVGGALGLAAAANAFFGQTEAPLLVRAYLNKFTRSELFALMTAGLATVAGSVIVLYATILRPVEPSVLGHIIVASLISLPAALLMARIMVPPAKGEPPTTPSAADDFTYDGAMDAFMRGAHDGLQLFLNIIASLIVFIALVALINIMLSALPDVAGAPITVQRAASYIFAPLVWLMGVPAEEMLFAGELMGVKTVLNEVVAYLTLSGADEAALSERTRLILIYALCGFANVSSLGIIIGGFNVLIPERRSEIIDLSFRALIAGTLATMMTGSVIGVLTAP